jgi:zinc protease
MRKLNSLVLAIFLIVSTWDAYAQTTAKLIETVAKKEGVVNIPYQKYVLPNGLKIIIHEDHSDPIAYIDVTYHVGSARELPGRSGFAHFFEHMMFQGSDHVADEEHFKIIEEAGGDMNGTTSQDRTNYFEVVPSNYLETALWLESDRMGFLLDAVTQEKFEIQRATVKNERGQNYDNKPYGLVSEKFNEALYPFGHPYSWTTIGYIDDLNAATLDDLKNFFLRWYGPNNATLTIAGDVNVEETLKLVEKYFGNIKQCPEVKKMQPQNVVLEDNRYISYEDNIKFPLLSINFPTIPSFHPDEAPLDVLSYVIGGGGNTNSLFYQKFIKTQLAVQAYASNPCAELTGFFTLQVLPIQSESLTKWENDIKDVVNNLTREDIEKQYKEYALSYVSDIINNLTSVQNKGAALANYQVRTSNPNYTPNEIQRYLDVTVDDIWRVYEKYIKNKPTVVVTAYPKGMQDIIPHPDNVKRPEAPQGYTNDISEYTSLKYEKAKDDFDRSIHPAKTKNPEILVPAYWKKTLANGVKIIATPYDEVPITNISLFIKGGKLLEPKGKAGLATITTNLMMEATLKHNSEELSSILNSLGSTIDISAQREDIVISVNTLNKNINPTLALFNELLFQPKFDTVDFDLIKNQQLQLIKNQQTNASAIAQTIGRKLVYDENSALSHPENGSMESVSSITIEDVKQYYNKAFAPENTEMVVVGDIKSKVLMKKMAAIKKWKRKGTLLPAFAPSKKEAQTTIYFCHKDKSPQSVINISSRSLPYDGSGDFYKLNIANYPLGYMFNSRINLNLREEKGYTYGARSAFVGSENTDRFYAGASVRADITDLALVEFMKEISNFVSNGITEQELANTKVSIGQSDALNYEAPTQKAGFLRMMLKDEALVEKQKQTLKNATKQELDNLFRQQIDPKQLTIIVVGDRAIIYDKLKQLGYPIVEVDFTGKKL